MRSIKKFTLAIIFSFLSLPLWAQLPDFSGGFSLGFTYEINFLKLDDSNLDAHYNLHHPILSLGVFGDLKYLQADLMLTTNLGGHIRNKGSAVWGDTWDEKIDYEKYQIYYSLQLLGKLPFDWKGITIFPAVGMEFQNLFLAYDKDGNPVLDTYHDQHRERNYIKLGVGVDIPIKETMYLRTLALTGYRLLHESERDYIEHMEIEGRDIKLNTWSFSLSMYAGFRF